MKRKSLRRSKSRKLFRKGANRVHSKNRWQPYLMRGGIRL